MSSHFHYLPYNFTHRENKNQEKIFRSKLLNMNMTASSFICVWIRQCFQGLFCLWFSCARPSQAASALSPAQQIAPLLPPMATDISYRSHYSPQEVVPKLPPTHHVTIPRVHLSLIRLERHLIHADHSNPRRLDAHTPVLLCPLLNRGGCVERTVGIDGCGSCHPR